MAEPKTDAERLRAIAAKMTLNGWHGTPQPRNIVRDIADRVERLERIAAAASDVFVVRMLRSVRSVEAVTELDIQTDAAIDVLLAAIKPPPEPDPCGQG